MVFLEAGKGSLNGQEPKRSFGWLSVTLGLTLRLLKFDQRWLGKPIELFAQASLPKDKTA